LENEAATNDGGELFDRDTAHHIFANSPTMLALCLTSIGLIKIYASLERVTTVLDDCLAVGVIAFLIATVFAYLGIRATARQKRLKLEQIADIAFLSVLGCAAVVGILVTVILAG
jgi:hypothetical protein